MNSFLDTAVKIKAKNEKISKCIPINTPIGPNTNGNRITINEITKIRHTPIRDRVKRFLFRIKTPLTSPKKKPSNCMMPLMKIDAYNEIKPLLNEYMNGIKLINPTVAASEAAIIMRMPALIWYLERSFANVRRFPQVEQ